MESYVIWNVKNNVPQRLVHNDNKISREKDLEQWIEHDPTMINANLVVLGRQLILDDGRLDLLCIDRFGTWVVIEIKKGKVTSETIGQAVSYASSIYEMPFKELERIIDSYLLRSNSSLMTKIAELSLDVEILKQKQILVYVVGTGRDQKVGKTATFLAKPGLQISVVNFDVFDAPDGSKILLRQMQEIVPSKDTKIINKPQSIGKPASTTSSNVVATNPKLHELFEKANSNGIGTAFQAIYEIATSHSIYPKMYKHSIMYAPMQNKNRVLFCAWATTKRQGMMRLYFDAEAFAEFYNISESDVKYIFGNTGDFDIPEIDISKFKRAIHRLFKRIAENEE